MENQNSGGDPSEFEVGGDKRDDLFAALSDSHRRFTLQYLLTSETPVSVGELAAELEAWEDQRSVPDQSGNGRNAIQISLTHNHLPKLADVDIVRYDAPQQTVALANRTAEVRAHLQERASDKHQE